MRGANGVCFFEKRDVVFKMSVLSFSSQESHVIYGSSGRACLEEFAAGFDHFGGPHVLA